MIFGGAEHEQVALDEARPGDYFYYIDEGRRLARIARVEKHRGALVFVTKPVDASVVRIAQRARRIPTEKVVSVWRKSRRTAQKSAPAESECIKSTPQP